MINKAIASVAVIASGLFLSACDQLGGSPAAIIDLTVVAEATGQDEEIRLQAEAARNELGQQLQQIAAELDAQILAEQEKMGENPTAEQEQQIQFMTMQARQQLSDAQSQAQAQISQIEQTLVDDFRAQIIPLASKIAIGMGAKIVVADDAYLVWYEDSLDITDEVIAAWRARPEEPAEADTAELEEELEQVEDELAETQEQLEELKEVVEEGAAEAAVE